MPLLYGEGPKAFLRLQQEIMKQTDDQTLFAWKIGFEAMKDDICRPLASHPSKFRGAGSLIPTRDSGLQSPFSMTNKGLRIEIPVIHWDDGPYGVAILNCSTYSSVPEQLALPIVRLGPPGCYCYARDARHIGPLNTVYSSVPSDISRSEKESAPKLECKNIKTMTIYMKQEPAQQAQQSAIIAVRMPDRIGRFYHPRCWSAKVTALTSQGISEDTLYGDIHVFPPGHRRGAVLMQGDDRSHLLVFFNAEMENLRGYACKILYSPLLEPHFLDIPNPYPRTLEPSTSRIYEDDITPSQKLVQDLANTVLSALEREDDALSPDFQGLQAQQVFANEVDRSLSWNLMHDHYGPSNTEYDITECHMDFSAYAHIGPNKENGISIIIVKINFKEVCELQGSLYELEGSPAPIIKKKY
ncbi:hypothetical protein Ptr902_03057 [Pyrenophora tritici-repentis]|nr:hypothetical protein Ptr902_03057 [Pyrenophora tritici-repentis]